LKRFTLICLILIIGLLFAGCTNQPDPVDNLDARFQSHNIRDIRDNQMENNLREEDDLGIQMPRD
jgi:PBP1b-binding outer membrane lipoprotein LpoB